MGEVLVIQTSIDCASDILKVIGEHDKLYWDWGSSHLDVAARWLPKKGFKILPKIFDCTYKPGTVGDEGDRLIMSVRGCLLRHMMWWRNPRLYGTNRSWNCRR